MNSIIVLSPTEDLFSVISQYTTPIRKTKTRLQLKKHLLLSSNPKDMTVHSLLLVNSDLPLCTPPPLNTLHPVITYGCHPKATVTASSICEDRLVCCIQRPIEWNCGHFLEPQEISVPLGPYSLTSTLGGICVLLLSFGESFFS